MYIITVVQVYSVVTGASHNQIRTKCPIPDLFRTIFGILVRIRNKSGIPDLFGHTEQPIHFQIALLSLQLSTLQ